MRGIIYTDEKRPVHWRGHPIIGYMTLAVRRAGTFPFVPMRGTTHLEFTRLMEVSEQPEVWIELDDRCTRATVAELTPTFISLQDFDL